MRSNPVRRHHHRRRPYYAHRRRTYRNPSRAGSTGLTGVVKKAVYVGAGAIGSRALTQMVLGSSNVSWMGYGGNAIATLLLAWAGGKFLGGEARNFLVVGGAVGILLRMLQDLTPWGQTLSLSGFGDPGISGLGAYFTSSYVDPRIYTGQGAELRVPPAWQSQVIAAPAAMRTRGTGWATGSTYAPQGSTYRRAA